MRAQLIVGFVEVAFDGGVLDRAIHPLDLAIRPRMLRLRQPVVNIIGGAGIFEGMRSEGLLLGDHLPDFHRRRVASGIGEVGSVIGKDRGERVRDGLDQPTQEVCGVAPGDRLAEFDKGELRGPVDGDKEIELALGGSNLRDVDMEIADRIGLELPLGRGLAFDLGGPSEFRGAASSGATTSASDAGWSAEARTGSRPAAAAYACGRRRSPLLPRC